MEQWTKSIKRLIIEELNNGEATVVSEVHFLIQQLQAEVQQDLKATFLSLKDIKKTALKRVSSMQNPNGLHPNLKQHSKVSVRPV